MFQFTRFASLPYIFRQRYPLRGGFPHSDIFGSKFACNSPKLFAACHVLHRLYAPRYPPNALKTFDLSTSRHAQKSDQIYLLSQALLAFARAALGLASAPPQNRPSPCSKKQSKNITSTSNKHINPTTIHNSYLKLNTTHGSPGHLEPGHPQLGCIHFLFTISNKTQRPKPSLTACAVFFFFSQIPYPGLNRRREHPAPQAFGHPPGAQSRLPRLKPRTRIPTKDVRDGPNNGVVGMAKWTDVHARRGPEQIPSNSKAVGGGRRDRTDDLMLAKHALSQLSYAPVNR